jgi:iron-sulfur cluster repair protein YtfE (RIC family)
MEGNMSLDEQRGTDASYLGGDDRFVAMGAAHAAFRRDLEAMARVATRANLRDPARHASIMSGWQIFKNQLLIHHSHEDRFLWPRMRERLARSETAISMLDEMEAEHELIDPLLAAVDGAFDDPDNQDVAGVIDELGTKLSFHLGHEERDAMPMISESITDKEWRQVVSAIRTATPLSSAAEFMPWLTDQTSETETKRILSILPPPARLVYRRVWKPRYDQVSHW